MAQGLSWLTDPKDDPRKTIPLGRFGTPEDIANAVYDGTSAIMLSGETAAGKYPVQAVATMAKIAETTESTIDYKQRFYSAEFHIRSMVDAISHSTCGMAIDIDAKAIVACSLSGMTARMVSRFRSPVPIIGLTTNERTWRKLALSWGVTPAMCEKFTSTDLKKWTHIPKIVVAVATEEQIADIENCTHFYDTEAYEKYGMYNAYILVQVSSPIESFRFEALTEKGAGYSRETLYETNLTPDQPVIIHTYINDTVINRGYSFLHETGVRAYGKFGSDMAE